MFCEAFHEGAKNNNITTIFSPLKRTEMSVLFYITQTVFGVVVHVKDRQWHDMNFEHGTKINAGFLALINKYHEGLKGSYISNPK